MINTFVCTTQNRCEMTRMCIESLFCSLDMREHAVTIVDDGSTDRTEQLSRWLPIIANDTGGLYRSWNLGIKSCKTEYVTVINNDIVFFQRDWWKPIHHALASGDLEFAFPDDLESEPFDRTLYSWLERSKEGGPHIDATGNIRACCFTARKELFDRIGYFDESFRVWYGEKDFEVRMLLDQVRYGFVSGSYVRHLGSMTIDPGAVLDRESVLGRQAYRDYTLFKDKMLRMPGASGLFQVTPLEELDFAPFSLRYGKPGADRSASLATRLL